MMQLHPTQVTSAFIPGMVAPGLNLDQILMVRQRKINLDGPFQ